MNRSLDKLFQRGGRSQADSKTRWMSRSITEREYQDFRRHLAFLTSIKDADRAIRAGQVCSEAMKDRPKL